MRDEDQMELLSAAQAVVNDADRNNGVYEVDAEIMDDLKKVVRQIHDHAVATIEEAVQHANRLQGRSEGA